MMDKQADPMRQEQRPEPKEFRREPPQTGDARTTALPAQSLSAWMAGVPVFDLPAETALELASRLGNAALGELLGGMGGVETTRLPLRADGELPVNAARAAPPELTEPSGLQTAGMARHPCAPSALLDRTAPAQGANLFEAAMGGET